MVVGGNVVEDNYKSRNKLPKPYICISNTFNLLRSRLRINYKSLIKKTVDENRTVWKVCASDVLIFFHFYLSVCLAGSRTTSTQPAHSRRQIRVVTIQVRKSNPTAVFPISQSITISIFVQIIGEPHCFVDIVLHQFTNIFQNERGI